MRHKIVDFDPCSFAQVFFLLILVFGEKDGKSFGGVFYGYDYGFCC